MTVPSQLYNNCYQFLWYAWGFDFAVALGLSVQNYPGSFVLNSGVTAQQKNKQTETKHKDNYQKQKTQNKDLSVLTVNQS